MTCKPKPNLIPRKDAEGGRSAEGRPPWLYTTDAATPQGGNKRLRSGALTSLALLARTDRSMSGRRRSHATLPGGTSHLLGPAGAPSPPAHLHTLQPLPRPRHGAHAGPRDSERARHGKALKGTSTPGLCSCNAVHARDEKREHKKENATESRSAGRRRQGRAGARPGYMRHAWRDGMAISHACQAPNRALLKPQARDEVPAWLLRLTSAGLLQHARPGTTSVPYTRSR